MGLLKSVDNVPGIDFYEYRDELFYGKYEFRMRVDIPHVRYTWWCKTPEELDLKLGGKSKKYGTVRKEDVKSVTAHLPALKKIIEIQAERKKNKKIGIRIEANTVAIFGESLDDLKNIEQQLGSQYIYNYTQVQTAPYAGTKYFVKDPTHKFRVYLKTKRVDDNFHNELRDTMSRQKSLFPSPALRLWMNRDGKRYGIWYFRWTSSAHFIDYDDESTLSYLALMHGDVLGKKYKLEKRPDPV